MDAFLQIFTAITELIKVIVWPLIIMLILYSFREHIRIFMSDMQRMRVKHGESEVEFEKLLDETRDVISTITQDNATNDLSQQSFSSNLSSKKSLALFIKNDFRQMRQIANVSPRAGIMLAWSIIENKSNLLAFYSGYDERDKIVGKRVLTKLIESGQLPIHFMSGYEKLRLLRNKAAHNLEFNLSVAEASEYIDLAETLIVILDASLEQTLVKTMQKGK